MKMIGLARIGRDVELAFAANGTPVLRMALAYNFTGPDKEKQTQWVDGVMFGKRAASLSAYLTKGTLINVVMDSVNIRTYQKKDGSTGHSLSAVVSEIEFAGSSEKKQDTAPASKPQPQKPSAKVQTHDDFNDDIPF